MALGIYYFQHRKSYDIDLFCTDAQILDCLRPRYRLDESRYFKTNDYIVDLNHHIRFMTNDNIKVDILVARNFIDKPLADTSKALFKYNVYIESIEDIIAKKIVHRGSQNKSRDIADISVALYKDKDILRKLLRKEAINKNDIMIVCQALKTLDINKYKRDIKYVEPTKEYIDIANKAPNIIYQVCEEILKSKLT